MKTDLAQLAQRFITVLDAQDWPTLMEMTSPQVRARVNADVFTGREQWIAMAKMFYGAFPDARHETEDVMVVGDRVIVRYVYRGTHKGPFGPIPATGKAIALPVITIDRIVDGKVVEHWGTFDSGVIMKQLGLAPQ